MLVNECCCGCSLRSGSLITGCVALFLNVLQMIGIAVFQEIVSHQAEKDLAAYDVLKVVLIVAWVINALMTVASILLIIGTLTERSWCLITWVVVYRIMATLFIISISHNLIRGATNEAYRSSLMTIPVMLVYIGLIFYSSVVVISHYRSMKNGSSSLPQHTRLV